MARCDECGIRTKSVTGLCTVCRLDPTKRELTGGHWQKKPGGLRVWIWHICDDCGGRLIPGDRCDTCLTWAVKNARDFEWSRISLANRGRIWDALELRHEQELMTA